jgi:uridine phosphorylase
MTIIQAFDDTSEEVLRASQLVAPVEGFPETVIVTYSRVKFQHMLESYPCEQITLINTACAEVRIYRIEYEGAVFSLYLSLIGGSIASAIMEEVIAMGGRRFLFFGSCGVLDSDILAGHIAVPTAAYRDEGTSYHYLPPSPYVEIPTAAHLVKVLGELDIPFHTTRTWTTDAIYRETRANMKKRKDEGCRVVEMECASTAAVASFRNVEFYQFLYGADSLDGDEWDARTLAEVSDEDNAAIGDLALKVARRLV